jgi:hypothetical protein
VVKRTRRPRWQTHTDNAVARRLLNLVNGRFRGARSRGSLRWVLEAVGFEHAEQVARDVAFEALDFAGSLAFGVWSSPAFPDTGALAVSKLRKDVWDAKNSSAVSA